MTKAEVKLLAICFTVVLSAGIISASEKNITNSATAIPWNQIGARVGADYKGDGLTVLPTESGARLHCLFQRLDAEATPEGLWLSSTAPNSDPDRFRVTAMELGRKALNAGPDSQIHERFFTPSLPSGDHDARSAGQLSGNTLVAGLGSHWAGVRGRAPKNFQSDNISTSGFESDLRLPANGTVTLDAQTVRFTRLGLTEEYTVSMDGLRQDFIVQQPPYDSQDDSSPSPPSGERAGVRGTQINPQRQIHSNLILKLSIAGATVESATDGATLILQNSGRKIAYNRLRVTDATGKELPAHIETCPTDNTAAETANEIFCPNPALWPDTLPLPKREGWGEGENDGKIFQDTSLKKSSQSISIVINDTDALYPLRIDPTFSDANWISLGVIPGANGGVNAMATDASGDVVIAGSFSSIGSMSANNIAIWNRTNWASLGSGIVGPVNALVFFGGKVYAGGSFSTAGGQTINNLAQWDGTNWSTLGSGINGGVSSLAVAGGTMYVAGGGRQQAVLPPIRSRNGTEPTGRRWVRERVMVGRYWHGQAANFIPVATRPGRSFNGMALTGPAFLLVLALAISLPISLRWRRRVAICMWVALFPKREAFR